MSEVTAAELFAALKAVRLGASDNIAAINSAIAHTPDIALTEVVAAEDMAPLNEALDAAYDLLERAYREGIAGREPVTPL